MHSIDENAEWGELQSQRIKYENIVAMKHILSDARNFLYSLASMKFERTISALVTRTMFPMHWNFTMDMDNDETILNNVSE